MMPVVALLAVAAITMPPAASTLRLCHRARAQECRSATIWIPIRMHRSFVFERVA